MKTMTIYVFCFVARGWYSIIAIKKTVKKKHTKKKCVFRFSNIFTKTHTTHTQTKQVCKKHKFTKMIARCLSVINCKWWLGIIVWNVIGCLCILLLEFRCILYIRHKRFAASTFFLLLVHFKIFQLPKLLSDSSSPSVSSVITKYLG